MVYAIVLGICIVGVIGIIVSSILDKLWGDGWELIFGISLILLVLTFPTSVIWGFCGGMKYITKPTEYNYVLENLIKIPELDTKKDEITKHDVIYLDSEHNIIYIDKTSNEAEQITVHHSEPIETARMEIYRAIPKNTSTSVDIGINRTYHYDVYVPKGYKVFEVSLA